MNPTSPDSTFRVSLPELIALHVNHTSAIEAYNAAQTACMDTPETMLELARACDEAHAEFITGAMSSDSAHIRAVAARAQVADSVDRDHHERCSVLESVEESQWGTVDHDCLFYCASAEFWYNRLLRAVFPDIQIFEDFQYSIEELESGIRKPRNDGAQIL